MIFYFIFLKKFFSKMSSPSASICKLIVSFAVFASTVVAV